jgi:hypothetical protein
VVVAGKQGRSSRLLIDTGDPALLVARARTRDGEGALIGTRGGAAFELHVTVARSRGIATVEIDGKRVVEQRPVPRNDFGDRLISIKSFEPLRLVSATIEVAGR